MARGHARPRAGRSSATCARDPTDRDYGGAALAQGGRRATFESYGRYWLELFRLPDDVRGTPEIDIERVRARHRTASSAAGGVILALPAPRQLGLRRRVAGAAGPAAVTVVVEPVEPPELFEWFAERDARSA